MGHRAIWLDYVRCVSHFGNELCGVIRDAETATAWKPGPHWTRHIPDVRDWGHWSRNMHIRHYAAALSAIHQGHTSRDIRHQPVGASSICSAAYQPEPGPQQRTVETGEATSTMDSWVTVVWLSKLCGLLGYFCVPVRTGCLWSRR